MGKNNEESVAIDQFIVCHVVETPAPSNNAKQQTIGVNGMVQHKISIKYIYLMFNIANQLTSGTHVLTFIQCSSFVGAE